jgi:hypothetical protein
MRMQSQRRVGRLFAGAIVLVVLSSAGAAARQLGGPERQPAAPSAGDAAEAKTIARLATLAYAAPGLSEVPIGLGTLSASAVADGGLLSDLLVGGLRSGDVEAPALRRKSNGRDAQREHTESYEVPLDSALVTGGLSIGRWHVNTGRDVGALSEFGLVSGRVSLPGVGFRANLGERGLVSSVRDGLAESRFAITLEEVRVDLGALLPPARLPLGLSHDLVAGLDLPVGPDLRTAVDRVGQLAKELAGAEPLLDETDAARARLDELLRTDPAVAATLDALAAAQAAAAEAAADLAAAVESQSTAQSAADTTAAALASAEAVLSAAAADLAAAAATVDGIEAEIASVESEIASLEAEKLLTLDPLRLLEIDAEIAALESRLSALGSDLATAQAAESAAYSVWLEARTSADAKRAANDSAQAVLSAATSAVAAAGTAMASAGQELDAARAAAAAAAAAAGEGDAAVDLLNREVAALEERLGTLLQRVSDLLARLPALPLLEEQLDEALRSASVFRIGGLELETLARAGDGAGSADTRCHVRDVEILGRRPQVSSCSQLVALQNEAVDRVKVLLRELGAGTLPNGIEFIGPHGTQTHSPPDAKGYRRAEATMSALTLAIPEVRLTDVLDTVLDRVRPALDLLRSREPSRALLPVVRPSLEAGRVVATSVPAAGASLADQLDGLEDELDGLAATDVLEGLSTGGVRLVVASVESSAAYKATGVDDGDEAAAPQVPGSEACEGDPACTARCALGDCRPVGSQPQLGSGSGSGSDSVPVGGGGAGTPAPAPAGKLPHTGAWGGLAGLSLLTLGATTRRLLHVSRP